MKLLFLFVLLALPFTMGAYSLVTKKVDGHQVRIFVIPYDDEYRVTVSASNTGTNLKNLIQQKNGVAGINGAYFIPKDYTGKQDNTNTIRIMNGDGFSYSKYFPDTGVNGIFGFFADGQGVLVQNNIYGESSLRDNYNSNLLLEVRDGIANFPILLASSINLIPRYEKAGLITDKMKQISSKSFICRTEDGTIKMGIVEKISLLSMSEFIRKFGCTDAINLDNGGSLALYDQGKYRIGPGRDIMDAFVIVRK